MMLLIGRSFAAAIFTFYMVDEFIVAPDAMSIYMVSFHVSIFCYIGVLSSIIFYGGNKVLYEVLTHIYFIDTYYVIYHFFSRVNKFQPKYME